MPCRPGFWPVIIDDHATEETSGTEEHIFLNTPEEINSAAFGIIPACAKSLSSENGAPSRPIIMSRWCFNLLLGGNYATCADVIAFDKDKSAEFFHVVERLNHDGIFGFYRDLADFEIL